MGSAGRFLWIALSGVLLFYFLQKDDNPSSSYQPIQTPAAEEPSARAAPVTCDLWTEQVRATFTSRGATLQQYELLTAKYTGRGHSSNLTTTPDPAPAASDTSANSPQRRGEYHEYRQQLFLNWRNVTANPPQDVEWNVAYDSFDYTVEEASGRACKFVYRDSQVEVTKLFQTTGRPYEVVLAASIKNLAAAPRTHALSVDTVDWRLNEEVEGKMFRVSPYVTHVECLTSEGKVTRMMPEDFEPGDFSEPGFLPRWGWFQGEGGAQYAAVANAYFANAIASLSEEPARCQVQIEKRGDPRDPNAGAYYRARLAYPLVTLQSGESKQYSVLAYIGPKERTALAAAGGGDKELSNLIDLGFFSAIAKILVGFLLTVYGWIPNWGVAIIVLTVTARVLLFPLSVPGIKNMIAMRALKPDLDALNEKYKDDAQAKGLAQMELYKKRGVNPLKGCLPQMASMPVWFALYTTLQTAVELYNIPFLWFPDLTEPDPLYILPFIIGGTFFVQQKIMPMQADPAQQKMMMYMMPTMFTVFMLFLPSGLGVYMFTNSLLAILQQQVVERHVARTTGITRSDTRGAITVTEEDESTTKSRATKGKKGKRDLQEKNRAVLDKGKA